MPELPRVTAAEVRRALLRAGWYEHRGRGGHLILKHREGPGRVTLAMHPGRILLPKTLKRISEQAGLSIEEFTELL
ncbi:MAG: type II toxin-antitoxin system HicA family toxin [Dehalococcoidia bacterium]|nr:type II toxin-antitoxin system HicA family toxin [Dehalococcoidia bacterium]